MMTTREYKNTGDQISLLGFGCMRLPKIDPEKSDIDKEKAQEMIDYAYAHGVNYYDTAYPYHEGKSELFIGEALKKYPREQKPGMAGGKTRGCGELPPRTVEKMPDRVF